MKFKILAYFMMMTCAVTADTPEPKWEIEKAEAEARDSIQVKDHENIPYGTQQWLGSKDDITLIINTSLRIEWLPDAYSRIDIKQEDIKLVDQDGNEHLLAGTVTSMNTFEWSSLDFQHGARPSEYSTPSPTYVYRPIFRVPRTTRSGTLHLGEKSVEVTLSGVQPPLRAGDTLSVEIVSAQLLDRVETTTDFNRKKLSSVLTNPNGKILKITCNLTPQLEPKYDYSGISCRTNTLTIRTDKGIVVPTFGSVFMKQIKTLIHNIGNGSTVSDYVIYYAVPADIESFQMLFHSDPISQSFSNIAR